MTPRIGTHASPTTPAPARAATSDAERLRATARQLEGVFVEQMFKAMRETVPEGGATSGGSGEAMFTGMLDQSLAEEVPTRWQNGLAEALYRQLQRAAGIDEAAGAGSAAAPSGTAPSSPASALPILDSGSSTSAAPARAVPTEPQ